MFQWPKFASYLGHGGASDERVNALLSHLANSLPGLCGRDVLSVLFQDPDLVNAVQRCAPNVHHVGFVAPPTLATETVAGLLKTSPFGNQLRTFKSTILVQELSSRVGHDVNVTVVRGRTGAPPLRSPSVEIFVSDLPRASLEPLIKEEAGCHVALALSPDRSLADAREVLRAHGVRESPLMRNGPLVNHEARAAVLYVDVPGHERTRRLELIKVDRAW